MNKHMIIGIFLGGAVATAGGALALRSTAPKVAHIVSVTPITLAMEQEYATVTTVQQRIDPNAPVLADVVRSQPIVVAGQAREVCEKRVVTHQMPVKDENQVAGTAAGALIGGLLGHQVGGGNGKKAATALGAIAGGLIGKNVQTHKQQAKTYQTVEQDCRTVRDPDQTTGYNVTLNLNGQNQSLTMAYNPKGQLPVINGEVITDPKNIKKIKANIPAPLFDVAYTFAEQSHNITLDYAPAVGAQLPYEYGQALVTEEQLANLKARENTVIAYNVVYQSDTGIGEIRTVKHPEGNTLTLKNGQPIITAMGE